MALVVVGPTILAGGQADLACRLPFWYRRHVHVTDAWWWLSLFWNGCAHTNLVRRRFFAELLYRIARHTMDPLFGAAALRPSRLQVITSPLNGSRLWSGRALSWQSCTKSRNLSGCRQLHTAYTICSRTGRRVIAQDVGHCRIYKRGRSATFANTAILRRVPVGRLL